MATVTKEFVTAGRAIFTLEIPDTFRTNWKAEFGDTVKPHYTFKVNFKKGEGSYKDTYFIQLFTGTDNAEYLHYTYLGMLDIQTGEVKITGKSCRDEDSVEVKLLRRTLKRVWADESDVLEQHGFKLYHEGKCGRCGRLLTTPESVTLGLGPECIKYFPSLNVPVQKSQKAFHGTPVVKDDVPSDAGAPDPVLEEKIQQRLNPNRANDSYDIVARYEKSTDFNVIDTATNEVNAKQKVSEYQTSLGKHYVVEYRANVANA